MTTSDDEFNALLVKYRPFIIGQVIRRGGGADLEDNVQEVYLYALRRRSMFDSEKGSIVTWLRWQTYACLQERRVHQRKRQHFSYSMEYREDGTALTDAVAVDNPHSRVELIETLDAVRTLKPRNADVVLKRGVGMTFAEIGETYGASGAYADSLYREGLKTLRKRVGRREVTAS